MNNKEKYGEIWTPPTCVDMMLSMLPLELLDSKEHLHWLDPCTGRGVFVSRLATLLEDNRKNHTIHACEVNPEHSVYLLDLQINLKSLFPLSLSFCDFIKYEPLLSYDVIVGNPPYNTNGLKKVPTNTLRNKKGDGSTLWPAFIRKSITLLKEYGYLCMIVPSIWLKPDRAGIYDLMMKHRLVALRSFTSSETKSIFKGKAQTPTSIFVLQKRGGIEAGGNGEVTFISIYDDLIEDMFSYSHTIGRPIPTKYPSIVQKITSFLDMYGSMSFIKKTNMPGKGYEDHSIGVNSYTSVISCVFMSDGTPILKTKSNHIPMPYQNERKLIMAHKMFGLPYYDRHGHFGISNRDNYILLEKDIPGAAPDQDTMMKYKHFLSSSIVLFLFDTTRYRMRYLEKYAFELLPNIVPSMTEEQCLNDTLLCSFFGLDKRETEFVLQRYTRYPNVFSPQYVM
jgi:methylase of polypeptide subunit release factors